MRFTPEELQAKLDSDDAVVMVCLSDRSQAGMAYKSIGCDACGGPAWITKASEERNPDVILCDKCATKYVPPGTAFGGITDQQIEELAQHLGKPFDEMKAFATKVANRLNGNRNN